MAREGLLEFELALGERLVDLSGLVPVESDHLSPAVAATQDGQLSVAHYRDRRGRDFLVRAPVGDTALTARGRATRERILAAAATLIHERGVAGTSLDDVRNATGTSKSQLYHYFADKSALVAAAGERQVEQVLSAQQPELDALDSMAGLRRWRDRVVALHEPARCAGGCPLGRLANEVAGSDAAAREGLITGFAS